MVELDAPPNKPTSQKSNVLGKKLQKRFVYLQQLHCVKMLKCGLELLECSADLLVREVVRRNRARDLLQTCSAAPMYAISRVVLPTIPDIGHISAVLMLGPVADRVTVRQQSQFLNNVFDKRQR